MKHEKIIFMKRSHAMLTGSLGAQFSPETEIGYVEPREYPFGKYFLNITASAVHIVSKENIEIEEEETEKTLVSLYAFKNLEERNALIFALDNGAAGTDPSYGLNVALGY